MKRISNYDRALIQLRQQDDLIARLVTTIKWVMDDEDTDVPAEVAAVLETLS